MAGTSLIYLPIFMFNTSFSGFIAKALLDLSIVLGVLIIISLIVTSILKRILN